MRIIGQLALICTLSHLMPLATASAAIEWQFSVEDQFPLVGATEDISNGEYSAAGGNPYQGGETYQGMTIAHLDRFGVGEHFIPARNDNHDLNWYPKSTTVKTGKILVGIEAPYPGDTK